jgi:hypothetical protein
MWIRIKSNDNQESVETTSLAAHVAIQKERDLVIDDQIDEIKKRQNEIEDRERELKSFLLRTVTTAAIALLSSAVSLGVAISQFVKN